MAATSDRQLGADLGRVPDDAGDVLGTGAHDRGRTAVDAAHDVPRSSS